MVYKEKFETEIKLKREKEMKFKLTDELEDKKSIIEHNQTQIE